MDNVILRIKKYRGVYMDIKINFDEEEIVMNIMKKLNNCNIIKHEQKINIIFNCDSNDIV